MACLKPWIPRRTVFISRKLVSNFASRQNFLLQRGINDKSIINRLVLCGYNYSSYQNDTVFNKDAHSWSREKCKRQRISMAKFHQYSQLHSQPPQRQTVEEEAQQQETNLESSNVKKHHIPVMVEEVLDGLIPKDGHVIVDMTFGAGGHAKEILKWEPSIKYIASDRDPLAHKMAKKMSEQYSGGGQLIPILSRFSELPVHLTTLGITPGSVDGFLFDLGASSMQFDQAVRGFSLSRDGPLDMRMDGQRFPDSATAADIVNRLDVHDLAHIIKKYGEESRAREIAQAIVEARYAFGNFTKTHQLANVVKTVFSSLAFKHDKLFRQAHVATKTFQALRIFVNNELNEIHNGLEVARHFLKPGGRCVVISFHSLEDRIVKRHFHAIDMEQAANLTIHQHFRNANLSLDIEHIQKDYMAKAWRPLSRKLVEPMVSETYKNPRSRSAKLRVGIREQQSELDK